MYKLHDRKRTGHHLLIQSRDAKGIPLRKAKVRTIDSENYVRVSDTNEIGYTEWLLPKDVYDRYMMTRKQALKDILVELEETV